MNATSCKPPVTRLFSAFSCRPPQRGAAENEKIRTQCAILRYTEFRFWNHVGELIDPISSAGSMGLFSSLIGAAALGVYALWQDDSQNNDDDDSTPGGGLMQPVA